MVKFYSLFFLFLLSNSVQSFALDKAEQKAINCAARALHEQNGGEAGARKLISALEKYRQGAYPEILYRICQNVERFKSKEYDYLNLLEQLDGFYDPRTLGFVLSAIEPLMYCQAISNKLDIGAMMVASVSSGLHICRSTNGFIYLGQYSRVAIDGGIGFAGNINKTSFILRDPGAKRSNKFTNIDRYLGHDEDLGHGFNFSVILGLSMDEESLGDIFARAFDWSYCNNLYIADHEKRRRCVFDYQLSTYIFRSKKQNGFSKQIGVSVGYSMIGTLEVLSLDSMNHLFIFKDLTKTTRYNSLPAEVFKEGLSEALYKRWTH